MGSENPLVLAFIVGLAFGVYFFQRVRCASVTYDHRALVIDGKRRVLFSGSIHYPRTAPEVWHDIIRKSKEGGLDVIETYVFWNYHEPVRGQYFFEGRFDLVRFIKTVQEAGLLVHLRIGPYACAEWNYGGFPLWLHFIPGIQFRTTNAPFKQEMSRFLAKIVGLMKEEHLFASQGGPIILAQVENEYGNVEWGYGISGELYVQWAAHTALSLNTTVPWVMCQQPDAPDPIINTCNGFYCDQFTPNSKAKPKMWTECYTGWFLAFGYPIPYRPVEDLAFAVARFFETGGTFHNYYMYFGGTNFGRTAGGSLVATSYDYDAPIDEYGFLREPKWSHLRELHKAVKHCEEYLISSNPTHKQLGLTQEAHIYYKSSNDCAAFLANYDSKRDAHVTFRGKKYFLPAWSVSILPDCENVIFNTAKVVSQKHLDFGPSTRTTTTDKLILKSSSWSWYNEEAGVWGNSSFTASGLLEQIRTTKDTSDFLWYTTSINKPKSGKAFLNIDSLGHAALVFVNKRMVGFGFGNHDSVNFSINKIISLVEGDNSLDILSMMIGLQDYGPWFDVQGAGIFSVNLVDFRKQKHELTSSNWTYQVGLKGEYLGLDSVSLANSSLWENGASPPINTTLVWYKATFMAPEGRFPLALDLSSMGKGQAWVNGQSIGRYWPAYHSPSKGCTEHCDYRGSYDSQKCQRNCGQPTQTLYHVPRSWVHGGENLLVLHEELGGDPTKISVVARTGQEICAFISENDPPPVDSWKPNSGFMSQTPEARLNCEKGWHITSVNFASFGSPEGTCGAFTTGVCHVDILPIVHKACLGQEGCSVPVSTASIGDPCPGLPKTLAIEVVCS